VSRKWHPDSFYNTSKILPAVHIKWKKTVPFKIIPADVFSPNVFISKLFTESLLVGLFTDRFRISLSYRRSNISQNFTSSTAEAVLNSLPCRCEVRLVATVLTAGPTRIFVIRHCVYTFRRCIKPVWVDLTLRQWKICRKPESHTRVRREFPKFLMFQRKILQSEVTWEFKISDFFPSILIGKTCASGLWRSAAFDRCGMQWSPRSARYKITYHKALTTSAAAAAAAATTTTTTTTTTTHTNK